MREIRLYDGKAYGYDVSKYGLENGYLDYLMIIAQFMQFLLEDALNLLRIFMNI